MVEIAELEGADAVAHGATGKGNDQVRFELTVMALNPKLKIIAPWREWHIRSREDALNYAAEHNVPVTATLKSIYSRDRNLWHLSHEGGSLEDPWNEPEEDMFQLTADPESAPDQPEYVEIDFEQGVPKRINGEAMGPIALVEKLNEIGGQHGVGRVDMVENRLVGMKSRGVYETPGGTILYKAHEGLEQICLDKQTLHYKQMLALKYAELVYNGQWFTPLREALDAFVDVTQKHVTGTVATQAVQGQRDAGGTEVALQPVPRGLCHLRRGGRVQPEGRRGLHQAVRAAHEGCGHARRRRHGTQQAPGAGLHRFQARLAGRLRPPGRDARATPRQHDPPSGAPLCSPAIRRRAVFGGTFGPGPSPGIPICRCSGRHQEDGRGGLCGGHFGPSMLRRGAFHAERVPRRPGALRSRRLSRATPADCAASSSTRGARTRARGMRGWPTRR